MLVEELGWSRDSSIMDLHLETGGQVWHHTSLNLTFDFEGAANVGISASEPEYDKLPVPLEVSVKVGNFFGMSNARSFTLQAPPTPSAIKVRVSSHPSIQGLVVTVNEDDNHAQNGLHPDRYLVEYWPSEKNRVQILTLPAITPQTEAHWVMGGDEMPAHKNEERFAQVRV